MNPEKVEKYKAIRWTDQDGVEHYAVERSGIYGFSKSSIPNQPPFATFQEAQAHAEKMNKESKQ